MYVQWKKNWSPSFASFTSSDIASSYRRINNGYITLGTQTYNVIANRLRVALDVVVDEKLDVFGRVVVTVRP